MKKLIAILMVLTLSLSLFSGCGILNTTKNTKAETTVNDETTLENKTGNTSSGDTTMATTADTVATKAISGNSGDLSPADGYTAYLDAKGAALERIMTASEINEEASLNIVMGILPVSMIDLSLIFLTAFNSEDLAATKLALAFFGLTDINISQSEDTFTLTFKNSDGVLTTQTCKYDAANDRLTSSIFDESGKETMFFEYVHIGDSYVSQCYYVSSDGIYNIKSYFNADIAAFGVENTQTKPASILDQKNLNEDFVKNNSMYVILKGNALTYSSEGTETTY